MSSESKPIAVEDHIRRLRVLRERLREMGDERPPAYLQSSCGSLARFTLPITLNCIRHNGSFEVRFRGRPVPIHKKSIERALQSAGRDLDTYASFELEEGLCAELLASEIELAQFLLDELEDTVSDAELDALKAQIQGLERDAGRIVGSVG